MDEGTFVTYLIITSSHESRPQTPNLGVSDRVRLHVVFMSMHMQLIICIYMIICMHRTK